YGAEYERNGWNPGLTLGPIHTQPRPIIENATVDVSGAELAWEEFRDALSKYELPRNATPTPDPVERQSGYGKQRAGYKGAIAEWMARKGVKLLLRMTIDAIAADFKSYCEAERRD